MPFGPSVSELVRVALGGGSMERRAGAVVDLGRVDDSNALPALLNIARDRDLPEEVLAAAGVALATYCRRQGTDLHPVALARLSASSQQVFRLCRADWSRDEVDNT